MVIKHRLCCLLLTLLIIGCNKPKTNSDPEITRTDSNTTPANNLVLRDKSDCTLARIDSNTAPKNILILNVKSDYTVMQSDSIVTVKNNLTNKIDTVFANECQTGPDSTDVDQPDYYFFHSSYENKFLIGPFLSYNYSYDGSGGVHPIYGSYNRTINLISKSEVSLDSLFPPEVIYNALLKDSLILQSKGNSKPQNLDELVSSLNGGCEIDFLEFLKSYAITSVDSKNVGIEFGLAHGCEAMRGNYTTINIKLPISSVLSKYINR